MIAPKLSHQTHHLRYKDRIYRFQPKQGLTLALESTNFIHNVLMTLFFNGNTLFRYDPRIIQNVQGKKYETLIISSNKANYLERNSRHSKKNAAEIIIKQNFSCLLLQRFFNLFYLRNIRKNHQQAVFYRTVVLINLVELTGKHLLKPAAFLEIGM